jgi:hypothetical protein
VSTGEPDFGQLLGGDDLSGDEEARLRRTHDLLVAAGPPPELPPSLAEPPEPGRRGRDGDVVPLPLPRRRLGAALVLAAALAAVFFGGGYWLGTQKNAFESEATFTMQGTPAAPRAFAAVELAPADAAHNWPLLVRVRGLKDLPKGGYYELLLTKDGKPGPSCGTFRTSDGETEIVLNAPYPLKRWNGWIVVAHYPDERTSPPVLTSSLS